MDVTVGERLGPALDDQQDGSTAAAGCRSRPPAVAVVARARMALRVSSTVSVVGTSAEMPPFREVEPGGRAPILKRYLALAPGPRAHIPVDPGAPVAAFERVASQYPVLRVSPVGEHRIS